MTGLTIPLSKGSENKSTATIDMGVPDTARRADVYCSTGNTTKRGLGPGPFITLSIPATIASAFFVRVAFTVSSVGGTITGTRITATR